MAQSSRWSARFMRPGVGQGADAFTSFNVIVVAAPKAYLAHLRLTGGCELK